MRACSFSVGAEIEIETETDSLVGLGREWTDQVICVITSIHFGKKGGVTCQDPLYHHHYHYYH